MDWVEFLTDHHIDFVTRSPNVKKDNINIRCPWCGEDDPSHHLGISLTDQGYGCWRNPSHRGKSVVYLVKAVLGCSSNQATLILEQYNKSDPETLDQALAALLPPGEAPSAPVTAPRVRLLPEFRAISQSLHTRRFWNYLKHRGFDDPDKLGSIYDLKCCFTGRWKDRIIIPIYRDKKLVAWTGRAIQKSVNAPRYLSTSDAIKTIIFNEDEIMEGGDTLFITEGPFDAIKMDYYGYNLGARATCVFGTSMTIDQISLLKQATKKYRRSILLLDPDAIETSFNTLEWLPRAVMGTLPMGVEDPGDLLGVEVRNLIKALA